ncbi:MAG: FAD-containing monooxygenase EthA, partial [Mycobacterium sp.]
FCRLLAYMDAHGHTICYPRSPEGMPTRPLLDFGANYVKRSVDQFPRQGTEVPWRTTMDYRADQKMLREGPVDDDQLFFASASPADALEPVLTG